MKNEDEMEIRSKSGRVLYRGSDSASLHGVDLTDADLRGFDFSATLIYGNSMQGADLRGANLYWSTIQNADLRNANFEGANMDGITLQSCDLTGASLRGVNLAPGSWGSQASLCGTNLAGADLAGAMLDYVFFDADTTFPAGFDPAKHRMIHLSDWDAAAFKRDPDSIVWGQRKEESSATEDG